MYDISDYLSDVSVAVAVANLSLICQQRTIFAFELNESCVHFVDVAYVIVFGLPVKTPLSFHA